MAEVGIEGGLGDGSCRVPFVEVMASDAVCVVSATVAARRRGTVRGKKVCHLFSTLFPTCTFSQPLLLAPRPLTRSGGCRPSYGWYDTGRLARFPRTMQAILGKIAQLVLTHYTELLRGLV